MVTHERTCGPCASPPCTSLATGPRSSRDPPRPQAPPNAEASANDAGLWISPQLAHDQARLPWVVHEEVAHHYLATTQGVPHGGTFVEQLLHEMFATWLQLRVFVGGGWMTWRDVTTTPMPEGGETPEVGYHLGKHIAATAASSPDSRAHLERWLADESVEERLREFSRALLDGLRSTVPPPSWRPPSASSTAAPAPPWAKPSSPTRPGAHARSISATRAGLARSPRTAASSRCHGGPSIPAACASARRPRPSWSRTCGAARAGCAPGRLSLP